MLVKMSGRATSAEITAIEEKLHGLVSLDELVSRSFVFGVKRGAWRSV